MKGLVIKVEANINDKQEIGLGNVYLVEGYCFHTIYNIKSLVLELGDRKYNIKNKFGTREDVFKKFQKPDKNGNSLRSGFWQLIELGADLVGETLEQWLIIRLSNGEEHREFLGKKSFYQYRLDSLRYEQPGNPAPLNSSSIGGNHKVAICLAVYEPDLGRLRRQIDSIINQNYGNWICIICDDSSSHAMSDGIKEICSKDYRIYYFSNDHNLGFYHNFEECIRHIPEDVHYVSFSDQDDHWYPDKLESLVNAFDSDTTLVYSDMRIVNDDGEEISNTYWLNRKNNYNDLSKLLLANTVTGAAMMFRRELVKKILPFPEQIGDAFHDHWIACVALSTGNIKYLDRPLYDYYQYGNSVIGFCDFDRVTVSQRIKGIFTVVKEHLSVDKLKKLILKIRNSSLAVYRFECRRLMMTVRTIKLRSTVDDSNKAKALNLFDSSFSGLKLLAIHIKIVIDKYTTDDAELRLASGYIVNSIDRPLIKLLKNRIISRSNSQLEC